MGLRIKDISDMLNISPATVSLALNNKPGVSEETRQKILSVIADMGYDTNLLSKPALRNNKSIRFIVYKKHSKVVADTPFFSTLMEGIDLEARKNGYNLVISYINESENKAEVLRLIEENPLDGLIILATEMNSEDIKQFMQLGVPVVALDSYFEKEKLDTVIINNVQGAYEAVKYLIDSGHTDIGHLQSSIRIKNFEERNEGFMKALSDNKIKFEEKNVFTLEPTMEGAYNSMLDSLKKDIKLPTAFFADNDIIAFGTIKALREFGIQVPNQISIIGFDDMPFCEMIDPALTTIRVFKQRMGMLAVDRLINKIEGNIYEYIKLEIGTILIERKSVANPCITP